MIPATIYCLYRKVPLVNGLKELLFVEGLTAEVFDRFKKDNPEWEKDFVVREF